MKINLNSEEDVKSLRAWAISLLEDIPVDKLVQVVDVIEDAALTPEGDDPFYSEDNQAALRASIASVNHG